MNNLKSLAWAGGVCAGAIIFGLAMSAPDSDEPSATVSVNLNSHQMTMPPEGIGAASAVYENSLANPDGSAAIAASLAQAAGIGAFRYPGGSYSDIYDWRSNSAMPGLTLYTGPSPGQNSFTNFMERLVLPAHATAIITCNYGSDIHGADPDLDLGGDPKFAAEWVKFANVEHHYHITYWEIGNEVLGSKPNRVLALALRAGISAGEALALSSGTNYGTNSCMTGGGGTNEISGKDLRKFGVHRLTGWEYNMHPDLSPEAYGKDVVQFAQAMKAVDPTIKIGVFICQPGLFPDNVTRFHYNRDVLKNCREAVDFVVIHYYPYGEGATLLARPAEIPEIVRRTRKELQQYLGAKRASRVEIAVTETGAGANTGVVVSLWAADNYLSWLENGAVNVDYQELHNDLLLEYPHAPFTNQQPAHAYYGAQMAHLLAEAGDTLVQARSDCGELRTHAALRKDGRVAVMLLNTSATEARRVKVKVRGAKLAPGGVSYQFGRLNFAENGDVPAQAVVTNTVAEAGNTFRVTVPAYTMVDLLLPTAPP